MKNKIWLIVGTVVVIVFLYGLSAYNGLIGKREAVNGQWAQVQSQYQRRFDLIPNLVETVKGITEQEQTVFSDLAEARTHYSGAKSTDDQVAATNQVESALARLLVIVENYPELKSAENFLALQSQLEGTENRISVERQRFNDRVQDYNVAIKRFPKSLIASLFNFDQKPYFESTPAAATPPQVSF